MDIAHIESILLHAWSIKTSSKWTQTNPAKGQCSVTALVIHDLFGGEIVKTAAPDGWHFYNMIKGNRFDFTASQFEETLIYEDLPSSREDAFSDTSLTQYEELRTQVSLSLKSWNYHRYLHVYAQHSHHHESFIVGNREGLVELRDLIDLALANNTSVGGFFPSDDEGYSLYVGLVENEELFQSLEMPYTEQFGEKNNNIYFVNLKEDPKAPYSPIILFPKVDADEA
ncbi:hypothetical protein SAMN05421663_11084 [Terribacillus halophilus]|uniref:Uncharacterized protein n=1 Tax=Terribacillus halophilus TaxID=361279 RepID=A0A1G6UHT7_9BACI|nr:hypothetical protein SAMN05421663_11084 [Terribacillus halophilus]